MKPYGLVFHHFYDAKHPKGQGAISGEELEQILHHIGLDNILPAEEFQRRLISNKLKNTDVCITFDDNLRSQYDVAYPILKKYGITAFWFIYTSPLEGIDVPLEIYRYYRTVAFDSVDDFYDVFFARLEKSEFVNEGLRNFSPNSYLSVFPFYSNNDRKFRFIRDVILKKRYFQVMDEIIAEDDNFSIKRENLWLDEVCIKQLARDGHMIGLHSHTHPTMLAKTSYENQRTEYVQNFEAIKKCIGKEPTSVSYPSNSYNNDTLEIMRSLNISIGFIATMVSTSNPLTLPRNDHSNIII